MLGFCLRKLNQNSEDNKGGGLGMEKVRYCEMCGKGMNKKGMGYCDSCLYVTYSEIYGHNVLLPSSGASREAMQAILGGSV